MGVRRIPGAVVPALVEGEKPGSLPLQMSAHPHFVIIHCEMNDTAAELEEQFLRVPVPLVLLDGVLDRLLRQAVLELERGDG